jgi:hypothetical protein
MNDKNKLTLGILAILGWSAIAYWYFNNENFFKEKKKIHSIAEFDTLVQPSHYKKISLQNFKCVVIKCDLGPVKVFIEKSDKHYIQFHQSIMKFAEIDFKGDTLIVHTLKTPKSTPENPIYKQIYIYTPELTYYQAAATESVILKLKTPSLKIESLSSSVRVKDCNIDKLQLFTDHSCNYLIDEQNLLGDVYASINPNSAIAIRGFVDKSFTLKCEDMTNVELNRQVFKKLKVEKWK